MWRKISVIIAVIAVATLIAIIVIPIVLRSQVESKLKTELANRLKARITYTNFSLSLFRSFPYLNLAVKNISIIGQSEFKGDTLAIIDNADFSIDLVKAIKNKEYEVLSVKINDPLINIVIDQSGKVNWDILKTTIVGKGNSGSGAEKPLSIAKCNIQNAEVYYTDKKHAIAISSTADLSFNFKALLSDIASGNFEAITASGNAKVSDVTYEDKSIPVPVKIQDMILQFDPKTITLDDCNATFGTSDVHVKGTFKNFITYLLNKGDLQGNLSISSPVLNVNEWFPKPKPQPAVSSGKMQTYAHDTLQPIYFKVPAHINLTIAPQFEKVIAAKLVIAKLKGQLQIQDEAVALNHISGDLLGGSTDLSGKYNTKNVTQPVVNFSYNVKKIDIQQAYNNIKAIGEVGPGIKYVSGICSGSITGSGKLKRDMSIDYTTLLGEGKVYMPDLKISELPALNEIVKVTKIPSLQNLEVKDAQTAFAFKNGRVILKPTALKFANRYIMYLQGSSGFDQTVDYDMKLDVPAREMVSSSPLAKNILSFLPGLADNLPKTMGFTFKISGNAAKPNVKLIKMAPVDISK